MILAAAYALLVVSWTDLGPFDPARVGSILEVPGLKPGCLVKINCPEDRETTLPYGTSFYIELKSDKKTLKVRELNDLRGSVKIVNNSEALEYCRIWTNTHLYRCFDREALEVTFRPEAYDDGWDGEVKKPEFREILDRYPIVTAYGDRFIVNRMLVLRTHDMNAKCYLSTETVGTDGKYAVKLEDFKSIGEFAKIRWFMGIEE